MKTQTDQAFSTSDLAERWKCDKDTVLSLIQRKQLNAINLAINPTGPTRFKILLSEIERFEEARSTAPKSKVKV